MQMDGKAKGQRRIEETRRRKETCIPMIFWVKICFDNLNRKQREFLSRIFAEARWFWNYLVALKRDGMIPSDVWKVKEVSVKVGEDLVGRQLKVLMAQPRQAILKRIFDALKVLKKLRENGHKTGEIKFKSEFFSIPLPQIPNSFYLISKGKVKIAGCKRPFRVRGLKQIPPEAEVTSAYLIRRASGYYLAIVCWIPKEAFPKRPRLGDAIGVDFGIYTPITLSNGLAITYTVPPTKRLKGLQRALARTQKGSKNHWKIRKKYRKEHERLTNIRKDCKNRARGYLKRYDVICIQDENFKAWQQIWGRQMSWRGIGGITSGISPETLITLPRYLPTSQHCSLCGYRWGKLDLSVREVTCPSCGVVWDRDHNAARNIEKYGLATLNLSPPSGTDGVTPVEWQEVGRRLLASPYLRVCYLVTAKQVSCA